MTANRSVLPEIQFTDSVEIGCTAKIKAAISGSLLVFDITKQAMKKTRSELMR